MAAFVAFCDRQLLTFFFVSAFRRISPGGQKLLLYLSNVSPILVYWWLLALNASCNHLLHGLRKKAVFHALHPPASLIFFLNALMKKFLQTGHCTPSSENFHFLCVIVPEGCRQTSNWNGSCSGTAFAVKTPSVVRLLRD